MSQNVNCHKNENECTPIPQETHVYISEWQQPGPGSISRPSFEIGIHWIHIVKERRSWDWLNNGNSYTGKTAYQDGPLSLFQHLLYKDCLSRYKDSNDKLTIIKIQQSNIYKDKLVINKWPTYLNNGNSCDGKGAVTCAVCMESAWLVTFLIGNVLTGVVIWSALRYGLCGESVKNCRSVVHQTPVRLYGTQCLFGNGAPLDHCSLRRNLSAAACCTCDQYGLA